jgi:hypothetical protein
VYVCIEKESRGEEGREEGTEGHIHARTRLTHAPVNAYTSMHNIHVIDPISHYY